MAKSLYHLHKVMPAHSSKIKYKICNVMHLFRAQVREAARVLALVTRLHPHVGLLQRGVGQLQRELGLQSQVLNLILSAFALLF